MKTNIKSLSLALFFPIMLSATPSYAVTPAGEDQLRVEGSTPKKNGETLLSYTVTWRIDDGLQNRASGITFVHGPDASKPTAVEEIGKKMQVALNDAMEYLYPSWRGTDIEILDNKKGVLVSNKQGFDLTQLTFRDYSNQTFTYNLPDGTFSGKQVGVALDIVYAADVENIAEFTPNKPKISTGGNIDVYIDGQQKASVKTDGKSTSQIENDLARALGGASFSSTPIFPNLKDETTRNYKPFDGGEVQMMNLAANSIAIDINDPSLGILTKFDFPDTNKPTDVASRLPYIIFIGAGALFAYFFFNWYMQSKKEKEAEENEDNT